SMSDLGWTRKGHDHGAALARDLGYSTVYLHYNSGLHVSTNGRAFATLLESLVEEWPVPVEEMTIVAHSMGGLVTRSACDVPAADAVTGRGAMLRGGRDQGHDGIGQATQRRSRSRRQRARPSPDAGADAGLSPRAPMDRYGDEPRRPAQPARSVRAPEAVAGR